MENKVKKPVRYLNNIEIKFYLLYYIYNKQNLTKQGIVKITTREEYQ
jgi:hypothetical protein